MIIFRKAIRNNKLYKMDTIVTFGPLNYWFLVSKIKLAVVIIIIKKRKWWLNKVLNLSMLRGFLLNTREYIVYFTPRCRFKKVLWFLPRHDVSLRDGSSNNRVCPFVLFFDKTDKSFCQNYSTFKLFFPITRYIFLVFMKI